MIPIPTSLQQPFHKEYTSNSTPRTSRESISILGKLLLHNTRHSSYSHARPVHVHVPRSAGLAKYWWIPPKYDPQRPDDGVICACVKGLDMSASTAHISLSRKEIRRRTVSTMLDVDFVRLAQNTSPTASASETRGKEGQGKGQGKVSACKRNPRSWFP